MANDVEIITDWGEIVDFEYDEETMVPYTIITKDGAYTGSVKPNALVLCGAIRFIGSPRYVDRFPKMAETTAYECYDPRIVMMFLMPFWQKQHGIKPTKPAIPTMEEAEKWLEKADVPIRDFSAKSCRRLEHMSKKAKKFFKFDWRYGL